ncbi:hypothetical protein EVAR_65333_1 [Eumeta japonica]|uniref:Uncharacterized protein n=1 Tax=Eumeta variegata TaxID=151549 RepID=A0A4C1YV30_EUMVA|nr:hypothetical protein EVAR_65333_1 [Eumeta japonica]
MSGIEIKNSTGTIIKSGNEIWIDSKVFHIKNEEYILCPDYQNLTYLTKLVTTKRGTQGAVTDARRRRQRGRRAGVRRGGGAHPRHVARRARRAPGGSRSRRRRRALCYRPWAGTARDSDRHRPSTSCAPRPNTIRISREIGKSTRRAPSPPPTRPPRALTRSQMTRARRPGAAAGPTARRYCKLKVHAACSQGARGYKKTSTQRTALVATVKL